MKKISTIFLLFSLVAILFSLFECGKNEQKKTLQSQEPETSKTQTQKTEITMVEQDLEDAQRISAMLSQTQYADPKGYFKIVPPANWRIQEYPQEQRGKVAFIGPESAEFRVLVNAVDYDFEAFISWCKDLEKRLGTSMNIERTTFDGKPAIRRTYVLKDTKFYAINFFIGKANHNLQYGAPPTVYDKYFPIVSKSMETYEPHLIDLSDDDVKKLYVAKKLRIAQLMMEMQNHKMALNYVKEGLEVSPADSILLKLKKEIEAKVNKQ